MPANSTYSFSSGQILTAVDLNAVFAQTVAFAADSSNANTGTLPAARLPYTMNQGVGTSNNVQFNDLALTGNLTVNGTLVYVNTTILEIADKNIQIAYNAANSAQANGGGLQIMGANVNFYYLDSSNVMILDRTLSIGNSSVNTIVGYDSSQYAAAQYKGNVNNYFQIAMTNANTGNLTSTDIALYDDNGFSGTNYIDLGISGSGYNQSTWTINGPSDGYLYTGNTNLSIGTNGTLAYVNFFTDGTLANNEVMRLSKRVVNIGNADSLGTTVLYVGNSATNTAINSSSISLASNGFFANATVVNAVSFKVGSAFVANTQGVYANAVVNAAALTVGSSTIANASGVYTATVNAASHTVGTSTIANASGVYATTMNAATFQVGATFTANATLVNAAAINITNQVNTATIYAATSANIASAVFLNGSGVQTTGYVNSLSMNTATLTTGGNVSLNSSSVSVGNTTLYANISSGQVVLSSNSSNTSTINSTSFTGTSNNASYLANVAAAYYVQNTDSRTLSGNLNFSAANVNFTQGLFVGANLALNTSSVSLGNSTVNSLHTATYLTVSNSTNIAYLYPTYLTVGNSSVNSTAVSVGSAVVANTTSVVVGANSTNTTITGGTISLSGVTINSSSYGGQALTANNSSYLGGSAAANFVQNTDSRQLSGNLYFTGANNYYSLGLFIGANVVTNTSTVQVVANSSTNTIITAGQITLSGQTVNSSVFTGLAYTANNASYLGGSAAANFVQNTDSRTLSGNINFTGTNTYFTTALYVGASMVVNTSTVFTGNGSVNTSIIAGTISISGQTVNGSVYTGQSWTANNATNLGGTAAAYFVQNTDSRTLSGNLYYTGTNTYFATGLYVGPNVVVNTSTLQVVANSSTNTIITAGQISISGATINGTAYTGQSNNALYLNGVNSAAYVQNTDSRTLSGNLYFTGSNNYYSNAIYIGANVVVNTSSHFVGNSSVNTNITSGTISLSGTTINSTAYGGQSLTALTANNATYLGGYAANTYLSGSVATTISNTFTFGSNVVFSNGTVLIANGSFGTNTQVLISNGTSMLSLIHI